MKKHAGLPDEKSYIKGKLPSEMRMIAPDYRRWRKALLSVNLALAAIVLLLEAILFAARVLNVSVSVSTAAERPLQEHLWLGLIIPTLINFSVVGLEALILKKDPKNDVFKNDSVMLTMTVICTVIACAHSGFENTLTVLCIPILTSVVFCSRETLFASGISCTVGLAAAIIFRIIYAGAADHHILPESIIAFMLILISEVIAGLVNALMRGQRIKLIDAIAEAKHAQRAADEANKAKSFFLANMSHEIRTPINAILGMNEMILREERDPSIRIYSANIQASGSSLLSIINDVLDISKIESGKIEIVPVVYEISSLINDCYNMAADRARAKDLYLKVECSEELPRMLMGDEVRVRQIIVNLLTNAVKYTEKGGVTLRIDNEISDDLRAVLKITVSDTGIGISEDDLDHLFEQFRRLDLEHNRTVEGTGLGLAIVKELITLMGGTILVRSVIGEGSEFTVYIPQDIVDEAPAGKIQLNYSRFADYEYVHSFEAPEARILVTDDLPMNLMVITNMLKESRMVIDTATSGKQAVGLTEKNHYDLILMDHMMPEMDGIETFAAIRADEKSLCRETPVIMLTANALSGVREQYMNEGFADYISKPIRSSVLEETIKMYLPPELVKEAAHTEKEPAAEKPAGTPYPELAPLLEALPQMNLAIAMPYCCDNIDLFMDILREYASSTRYEELEQAFAAENFDDYRRNAHSLKSTSLNIGLEGLSERARASEFAIKCENYELVRMNHPELMEMYSGALEKIRKFLAER